MRILHYQPVDRLPAVHFGYWPELLQEWADQGKIPAEIVTGYYDGSLQDIQLDRLIGWDFNWQTMAFTGNSLYPCFENKVLEELPDGFKRVQSPLG